MSLTVLSVAYPFAPVGPQAVGGAEQILGELDRALVAACHNSLVVACEGSHPAGRLYAAPVPEGMLDQANLTCSNDRFQLAIDRALNSSDVDLIHMHGLDFHRYRLPEDVPVLVTLHMPIAWYPREIWTGCGPNVRFQCVSASQKLGCPTSLSDSVVIANGVALPPFVSAAGKQDYAIALGRICPEKNTHTALEAGTLAGTRVLLGGQVFPYRAHVDYFRERIEPALQSTHAGPGHEFLGPLLPGRKQDLLFGAKCLLHPTLAPETSSLVAMEAFAVGTPVIAFRSGALPEIVEHGVTGFQVDTVQEMAEAIRNVHVIDPAACRDAAERRFSNRRMIEEYLQLYQQLTHASDALAETCAYV